jgi:hypothetical protein
MTDDLDRRLRGLVDEIEPSVVIAPASATRDRGRRHRTRTRAASGVAAVAAVGVIATGVVVVGDASTPQSGRAAASPAASGSPDSCTPSGPVKRLEVPPAGVSAMPSAVNFPPVPSAPANADGPPGTAPQHTASAVPCPGAAHTPADTMLRVTDLPEPSVGAWRVIEPGTWTGTAAEIPIAPGGFCMGTTWSKPDPEFAGPTPDVAPSTPLAWSGYSLEKGGQPGDQVGMVNETIATFPTEAEAAAAMARFVDLAAGCVAREGGMASVTPIGGDENTRFWKWETGNAYRGYEGVARSGRTIVTLAYSQQESELALAMDADLLKRAVARATG